jgi:hypothetical protein
MTLVQGLGACWVLGSLAALVRSWRELPAWLKKEK